MDRNAEFITHLSHLVALYAQPEVDASAERGALRAARAAAKHGACEASVADGVLRAGALDMAAAPSDVAAIASLLVALGVARLRVDHHARQDDIKQLAHLLADVVSGTLAPAAFADAVSSHRWSHVRITCTPIAAPSEGAASGDAPAAGAEVPATDVRMAPSADAPSADAPSADAPSVNASEEMAAADAPAPFALEGDAPMRDAASSSAFEVPSAGPLASVLPERVATLVADEFREHFDRLITSSSPATLRRFLEPIQTAIEVTVREGRVVDSVRLFLAMLTCEGCATDDEMRRQFVVAVRRLTKPTLVRAYAMLYRDAPDCAADTELALLRFGEDGAEAVIDRIGSATTAAMRDAYLDLLRRLPAAPAAVVEMLDDERALVVERGIDILLAISHPEVEPLLGELLGHASVRVRQAAARGLSLTTGSAFAGDALLRGIEDAAVEVRLAAAVALQARREARLAAPIAARVEGEPELEVQLALVTALGRIASSDAVQKLIGIAMPGERVMRRRQPAALRLSAIEALGEARTPAAMVALQKLLEDREKDVREAAARLFSRARRQTSSLNVPAATDS